MYTKEMQLRKNTKNTKKMSRGEYLSKCDWMRENHPICQVCGEKKADDMHHASYGAGGRDDKTIISICRSCHYAIHHGKGVEQSKKELIKIGMENHMNWRLSR